MGNHTKLLQSKLTPEHLNRLMAIDNPAMHAFVADAIELAQPDSVFICTDNQKDTDYLRTLALQTGQERPLAVTGHTYHFDGFRDQGRDKENTRYLLPKGVYLGAAINSMDKNKGIEEMRSLLAGSMIGKKMLVCFYSLGPANSEFSITAVQITDSPYVAHSENILYRPGYEQFRKLRPGEEFFRFFHSEGTLENGVSKNHDKRRMYIDLEDNTVYSVNTQYAGNSVGLKKLSLRLAINKASRQGWLAEHMLIMGVHGPAGRVTYFTGAFPSACGKTSTSMLQGQTIIGDDIAYLRKKDGQIRCANAERGIFGIIQDVNPSSDPVLYEALTTPGEVIFSNVLVTDDLVPHWLGMGKELPTEGTNYSGRWHKGKTDDKGDIIHPSHKNARYTLRISSLANRDPQSENPGGVPLGGIIYGGRDSDTLVPVEQAFNWTEGIILKGASLESETTAATLGAEGVRTFNLMSNIDFVSIPLGKYIRNNLDFTTGIANPPSIFSVNYFLKDNNGKYLTGMLDKLIWILWAQLRVHGNVKAIKTPTGFIPIYEDLAALFKAKLNTNYSTDNYEKTFTIRLPNLIAKFERIENIYRTKVSDTPQIVFDTFADVHRRLAQAKDTFGHHISPSRLLETSGRC